MTSLSNYIMKKNIAINAKPKKKSIPININSNPAPGKFLISNPINPIASSYLSMGQRIQISKNLKNSKIIHVNTNSATNYYTTNSKDSKQTNNSVANSMLNNYQSNNISENNGINFNFYINNNHSQQHYDTNSIDKNIIKYNNLNINLKGRKHLSTISNTLLPNELLINGYQTSKNNNNSNNILSNKSKNKIVATNSKSNISKIRQTYSTRPNFLDSRNKTKKVPMKSKLRQYKYQYKSGKPVSTSFSNVHIIKNNFQGSVPRNIYNYIRGDLINNITNENNNDIIMKNNTNGNYIINSNNLYEMKNKHFRHNTASFDNKDIINIFNKNNIIDKTNKNINNLNIKNVNNIGIKSNNSNICINNIDSNNKNINIIQNRNYPNKNNNIINDNNIINKRKNNQYSKGKINDIKIYVNEKKLNQKDSKYSQNINNNNNNVYYNNNNNNNNIYKNYHSNINNNNNIIKDNYNSNNIGHHMKNSRSINMNIPGIKKICVKQKEPKKNNIIQNNSNNNSNINNNKFNNKPIPNPSQKFKGGIIPSQRNIKINLAKFLEDVKNKQNNNKLVMGRKSLSIKRLSKENNSDFSLSQLNDKFTQKILKNNEEGNDIGNYNINNKQNINKTIQEENIRIKKIDEEKEKENEKFTDIDNIDNNILIDTHYISNIPSKTNINRVSSMPTNVINELSNNKENIYNNLNYNKLNYNANASTTTNNNYYGKNKNDYSVDNIPDLTNNNINNKAYLKNKENINDLNINNITDINNQKNNKEINIKNQNINNKNNRQQNINNNTNNNISHEISSSDNNNNKNISVDTIISKNNDIKFDKFDNINKKLDTNINNNLFDEDNLEDLPKDYDENFNDLYSIINKMNFGNVLVCVEGFFTPEGRNYKKFKDKFDKYYDKLYAKKGNSFANSNNKPKKIMEGISMTSNTKTNSSSSKKNIINPMYNDLNIVKDLNAY